MSILKKLEQEPYRLNTRDDQTREFSMDEIVETVREKILEEFPHLVIEARVSREKRQEVLNLISNVIISSDLYVPKLTRQDLAEKIAQEICGLGPLDDLLDDPSVTEIMVNGPYEIYIEKDGVLHKTNITFSDNTHLLEVINRIVQSVGRRVDASMPYVDARLPDGSRINAIIPPLALNGPVLTIRRFPRRFTTFSELIECGSITPEAADFLEQCV
ncbi:MAG: ATPase, T2SS/T4P/T4SS family, partial [Bacillota bacterium]